MFDEGLIDLNQKTALTQLTPFYIACHLGHLEIVKLLLNHPQIDVNSTNDHHQSAFFVACSNRDLPLFQLLLENPRVDPNLPDQDDQSALYIACFDGNYDFIKLLLASERVDVNQTNANSETPFYRACERGHRQIVRLFLESPREIDMNKCSEIGTPIYLACHCGNFDIAQLLLESCHELDLNIPGYTRWTILHVTCRKGRYDLVDLILDHPQNRIMVNCQDDFKCTEIWWAVSNRHVKVVKRLLASDFDIDVEKRGNLDETPFDLALDQQNKELVNLFGDYQNDKGKVREKLRKELKLDVREVARLLSLIVLLTDDYLQFQNHNNYNPANQNIHNLHLPIKIHHFFILALRLPLELQTKLCHLVFDSAAIMINSADFDMALKFVFRFYAFQKKSQIK